MKHDQHIKIDSKMGSNQASSQFMQYMIEKLSTDTERKQSQLIRTALHDKCGSSIFNTSSTSVDAWKGSGDWDPLIICLNNCKIWPHRSNLHLFHPTKGKMILSLNDPELIDKIIIYNG